MSYEIFTQRNAPYIDAATQRRLRTTRVLIAGCGIGSTVAETLVRLGCERLRLVDPDIVELHNLNRQAYVHSDVGRPKVDALAARLSAIWPAADVETHAVSIDAHNAGELVHGCELVLDTIDLVSLGGITAVHDAARARRLPAITALNIGFGAGAMVFPAGHPVSFRQAFGLPASGSLDDARYAAFFVPVFRALAAKLDPLVIDAVTPVLSAMAEGRPCPAPQVSIGAAAVAHLGAHLAVQLLAERPLPYAPNFIVADPRATLSGGVIPLEFEAPR